MCRTVYAIKLEKLGEIYKFLKNTILKHTREEIKTSLNDLVTIKGIEQII